MKTWAPAISGMLCLALGPGLIGIYGFFVEPLSKEFGVGVAVLNAGPVALILVPGILAPLIGKLADRLPIRGILLTGATLAMVSLLAVSQASTLLLISMGFLCFSLGLTMYGSVVVNGLMVKYYPGREARALAIAAIGMSLASATLPPLVGNLMVHLDWRTTLQGLSVGLLIALWLVILLCVPRGIVGATPDAADTTVKAFYRVPSFWLIGLCVALALNVALVLAICYPPHFTSQGYSASDAGWFLATLGMAGLAGKSFLAWFGDAARHYAKWLAMALLVLQIAGLCMLLVAEGVPEILTALCFVGFGGGAFIPMHPYLNSQYFDASIISQVNGAQMPLFLPFGLVGAPLAGYVYDQTDSFDPVLIGLATTLGIAALLVSQLPKQDT